MKKLLQNRSIKYLGVISFFAIIAYIQVILTFPIDQIIESDDIIFHVNRIYGLSDALSSGQFPFYINQLFLGGYGYAANWFYSDLFLLPAAGLVLLEIDFVTMYKIYLIIISIFTGLSMYYCTYQITKKDSIALLASTLYLLSNYRFVDIYVRGALGEVLAFIFLPLVLYGAYELLLGDERKWYLLTLAFTALLFSHVLSAVLAFILLVALCIIYYRSFKEYRRLLYLFLAGLVSLFTSAFFIFPFFEQYFAQSYWFQTAPLTMVVDNSLSIFNILQGIFLNKIFENDTIYFGLGIVLVLPLILRYFLYKKKEKNFNISLADRLSVLSLIFLFFVSDIFPWNYLSFLNIIQFPWRFYGIITLLLSFSGAIYIESMHFGKKYYYGIMIGIILLSNSLSYLNIYKEFAENRNTFWSKDSIIYRDNSYNIGAGKEYLPSAIDSWDLYYRQDNTIFYQQETTQITNYNRTTTSIILNYKTDGSDVFEFPLVYYPGYKAVQDGNELELRKSSNSLVEVKVNSIQGEIQVFYAGTTIQKSSLWISVISCFGIFVYYILVFKKKMILNYK